MSPLRQLRGRPTGGQFAARSRADSDVPLDPLPTQDEERRLTSALNAARDGNGDSLDADARARIVDFVFMPTRSNWERASGLAVNESGTTLEAATRASASYGPDGSVPSYTQALRGLEGAVLDDRGSHS